MRYYSSSTGEMVLQSAIAAGDTTITVDTTAGLPVAYPYTLFIDFGSANEEIVDVTAAAGSSLTVTRGRDGSVAQSHAFGAKIRHGLSARDLRESRDHEAATAAHGVTTVVGASETQTLDNKTFQPTGDHTAVKVRTVSANTAPAVDVRDEADARRAAWYEGGLEFLFGSNVVARIRQGGAVSLFKAVLELRVSDDVHAVVGTVSGTPTGRFLRLMNAGIEKFAVAANGNLTAGSGTFNDSVAVSGDLTTTGSVTATTTVSGSNITTMASNIASNTSAITGLDTRVGALETKTGSTMRSTVLKYTDTSTLTHGSTSATPLGARGGAGTFVAPASGIVDITTAGQLAGGTAGQPAAIGFEVRLNDVAGAVVVAYDVDDAVTNSNTEWIRSSLTSRISGLTPGATYYVRQVAASFAAGGRFAQGRVRVEPQF